MLNDEQLKTELKGLTAGDAVICLQIIHETPPFLHKKRKKIRFHKPKL